MVHLLKTYVRWLGYGKNTSNKELLKVKKTAFTDTISPLSVGVSTVNKLYEYLF